MLRFLAQNLINSQMRAWHILREYDYQKLRFQLDTDSQFQKQLPETLTVDQMWQAMLQADPEPNKQFVRWIIRAVKAGTPVTQITEPEPSRSAMAQALRDYLLLRRQRPAVLIPEHQNMYSGKFPNTLAGLRQLIDDYQTQLDNIQKKQSEKKDQGRSVLVDQSASMRIIQLLDLTAARFHGRGTKWCTASTECDYNYQDYASLGPLFALLPTHPRKYQITDQQGKDHVVSEKYQFWWSNYDLDLTDEKNQSLVNRPEKMRQLLMQYPVIANFLQQQMQQAAQDSKSIQVLTLFLQLLPTPDTDTQLLLVRKEPSLILNIRNASTAARKAALKLNGKLVSWLPDITSAEQDVAVASDGLAIQYISNPSEQQQLTAVRQNPHALQFLSQPSQQLQMTAVQQDGNTIWYLVQQVINGDLAGISEQVQLAAVHQQGDALSHLLLLPERPSLQVQLAAVTSNSNSIRHLRDLEDLDPRVQKRAVELNGLEIEYISDPSWPIQQAAINQNPRAILRISNPDHRARKLALQLNPDLIRYL